MVSLDATPGGLGVSADTEGKLRLWQTDTGEVRVGNCVCVKVANSCLYLKVANSRLYVMVAIFELCVTGYINLQCMLTVINHLQ